MILLPLSLRIWKPSGEGSHQLCQLPPTDMSLCRHSFPSCYEGNNRPCLCHGYFSNYPPSCNMNAFLPPRLFPPAFTQNFFHLKICSLETVTDFSDQPVPLLAFADYRPPQRVVDTLCFKFPLTKGNLVPLLTLGPPLLPFLLPSVDSLHPCWLPGCSSNLSDTPMPHSLCICYSLHLELPPHSHIMYLRITLRVLLNSYLNSKASPYHLVLKWQLFSWQA